MATKEYVLDMLDVDVEVGAQVLECLLHTVFFVRMLSSVDPVDAAIEDLELSYAKCNDAALDALIKERARQFQDLQVAGKSANEVVVSFLEKKVRNSGWSVFQVSQEESFCWEKWTIKLRFTGLGARTAAEAQLGPRDKQFLNDEVSRRIYYILRFAKNCEHLPQLLTQKSPMYAIDIPQAGSMWDYFRK